jgi:hypothetical protein
MINKNSYNFGSQQLVLLITINAMRPLQNLTYKVILNLFQNLKHCITPDSETSSE